MPFGYGKGIYKLFSLTVLVLSSVPVHAWLHDGGKAQYAGIVVSDTTIPVWVAAPFTVASDANATRFGVASGRIYGSGGMGYQMYLTQTLADPSSNIIAMWTISPQTPILEYRYVQPAIPILLRAGQPYYLIFASNSNNFSGSISWSAGAGYYGLGTADYGQTWYRLVRPLCVRVDGYAVPEPASLACLLLGVVMLAINSARRPCFGFQEGVDRE